GDPLGPEPLGHRPAGGDDLVAPVGEGGDHPDGEAPGEGGRGHRHVVDVLVVQGVVGEDQGEPQLPGCPSPHPAHDEGRVDVDHVHSQLPHLAGQLGREGNGQGELPVVGRPDGGDAVNPWLVRALVGVGGGEDGDGVPPGSELAGEDLDGADHAADVGQVAVGEHGDVHDHNPLLAGTSRWGSASSSRARAAASTSAAVTWRMHSKLQSGFRMEWKYKLPGSSQWMHGPQRSLRTSRLGSIRGAKLAGLVGPKMATTGVPTASAMWRGPESLPMKRRHSWRRAAVWRRLSWPVRSTSGRRARRRISSASSRSSSPPTRTTRTPFSSIRASATWAKPSGDQRFPRK